MFYYCDFKINLGQEFMNDIVVILQVNQLIRGCALPSPGQISWKTYFMCLDEQIKPSLSYILTKDIYYNLNSRTIM